MSVYLMSEVVVRDPSTLAQYRDLAAASHAAYGGRYVVRGGGITVLEGDRHPKLLIIVEFPDAEAARRWYASPEYAPALALRDAAFSSRCLMIVEGHVPAV